MRAPSFSQAFWTPKYIKVSLLKLYGFAANNLKSSIR